MKQPNNNAIALLVLLNILVSIIILFNMNKSDIDEHVAYANSIEMNEIEPTRKGNEENEVDPKEEEDILFNIESVTQHSADVNTIPLYFSHADEHGTFFTYTKTEQPKKWEQGYWYIDYRTLINANINPFALKHNTEIQGVYYPSNELGDSFAIKEVATKSKTYSYK